MIEGLTASLSQQYNFQRQSAFISLMFSYSPDLSSGTCSKNPLPQINGLRACLCMGNFQEPFSHTFIIVNTTALTIDYHIQISGKSHVLLYRAENRREKVDGKVVFAGRITYRL